MAMSWPVEKILEEALKLDPEDRALIAAELSEPVEDPEEVRRAWVRLAVELELAVTWYDTQRPGLGAEFLDALRATVQYAEDTPGIGKLEQDAPKRFDLRWHMMHRFPYALLVGKAAGTRKERLLRLFPRSGRSVPELADPQLCLRVSDGSSPNRRL